MTSLRQQALSSQKTLSRLIPTRPLISLVREIASHYLTSTSIKDKFNLIDLALDIVWLSYSYRSSIELLSMNASTSQRQCKLVWKCFWTTCSTIVYAFTATSMCSKLWSYLGRSRHGDWRYVLRLWDIMLDVDFNLKVSSFVTFVNITCPYVIIKVKRPYAGVFITSYADAERKTKRYIQYQRSHLGSYDNQYYC